MPLTVTRAQRDAIYELVVARLSDIESVWLMLKNGDVAEARRLGRAFADELRLLDDLGWAKTSEHEQVTLTVPPLQLTRTITRLRKDAAGGLGTYVARPKDDEAIALRDLAGFEALGELLGQLADGQGERHGGEEVSR
ncbi:MAG: hypothetical protein ACREX8_08950 [Gammaproteobacteria bacterium]